MTMASAFHNKLGRRVASDDTHGLDNGTYLQSPTSFTFQDRIQDASDNHLIEPTSHQNSSLSVPATPANRSTTQIRQNRLSSVPTSLLRLRSDSRVSYIEPNNIAASPAIFTPGDTSTNFEHKKSLSMAENDPLLQFNSSSTDDKRKTFNVLSSEQFARNDSKINKILDIPKNAPQELKPVLTLMNSQQARVYKEGHFNLTIEKLTPNGQVKGIEELQCFGGLSGNELAIWDINKNDFKPIYINVADASFTNMFDTLTIKIITPSSNYYYLVFDSLKSHKEWFAALTLCFFEFTSLHEAYTGALLSAKAVYLNDIKTLLAETRYSFGEWCNIKLNYLSSKWLKVYVVCVPRQKDKAGHIDIYSSDKTNNKKNLILTINRGFSCYSVYHFIPEAIDNSALIKVEGEITIHNWKFLMSKGVNNNSFMIPQSGAPGTPSDAHSVLSGGKKSRSRSSSLSSMKLKRRSGTSFTSDSNGEIHSDNTSYSESTGGQTFAMNGSHFCSSLYILPETHPGVSNLEIMVRLLIPMFDSFELYGRPKRLKSDKSNMDSLLFGMPVLPKSRYLDLDTAYKLVDARVSGLPVPREVPLEQMSKKKVVTVSTDLKKKKSKGLLSAFKKNKDKSKDKSVEENKDGQTEDENYIKYKQFETSVPVEKWTNREWMLYLKHELRYKWSVGFTGTGHLSEDFSVLA